MLKELRKQVLEANLLLPKYNLVSFTWGNVSAIDDDTGYIVIKPSGVEYCDMTEDDMVIVDFNLNVVYGKLNPSSDTPTHVELYKHFKGVKSIVHTHSKWATIFSQAKRSIKPYGTTHADYFYGEIPITQCLTQDQIKTDYEKNTGTVIIETFKNKNLNPLHIPAVLVNSHGPFAWGNSPNNAVHNAFVLEELSYMAYYTEKLSNGQDTNPIQNEILDKHFLRKHGENAYYGQNNK